MPLKILTDGNPDGTLIGSNATTDKIGFWGNIPVPQRTNPLQAVIGAYPLGQLVHYSSNNANFANVAANTVANQAVLICEGFNAVGGAGANCAAEMIIGISKATAPGNTGTNYVGIVGWRGNSAANVDINFANPAAANSNIIANEVQWAVATIRGAAVHIANCNANANCPANGGTYEATYTLGGTNATAVAIVSGGQVTGIQVTNSGAGYFASPTITIAPAVPANAVQANQIPILTGTMQPLPVPVTGQQATAISMVGGAGGNVTSIIVTDPGSGYTTAPTVTITPSTLIAPGMYVAGISNFTANLGIGNMRVAGKNQVAVQYVNPSAANIAIPAANWAFLGLTSMPAVSPILHMKANLAAANTSAAGSGTGSTNYVVPGMLANDMGIACWGETMSTGANGTAYILQAPIAAANAINMTYVGSNVGSNCAAGKYNFAFIRQQQLAPIQVFQSYVSNATALATNTTSEQVFTLSNGMVLNSLTNFNVLNCQKPSHTQGLSIVGCRANSNTQAAITFMNTANTNVTPPNEMYTFLYTQTPAATISANILAFHTIQSVSTAFMQTFALANELQQVSVLLGLIKGA
jgi:hypothetical protein